jgi:hypothetical protein
MTLNEEIEPSLIRQSFHYTIGPDRIDAPFDSYTILDLQVRAIQLRHLLRIIKTIHLLRGLNERGRSNLLDEADDIDWMGTTDGVFLVF